MSLQNELRTLERVDDTDAVAVRAATGGTITITGNYDNYEHLLGEGAPALEREVGPVVARLPETIREALRDSYGEGPAGLSPRELNLVVSGVTMAVLAMRLYAVPTTH